MRKNIFQLWILIFVLLANVYSATASTKILVSKDASHEEQLAAKEIRKYIYLRTNQLLPISKWEKGAGISGDVILVGVAGSPIISENIKSIPIVQKDAFVLKTSSTSGRKVLVVCGGSPVSTLYAAYHFAEQLGVGFFLDGDVIPDKQIPFIFPDLDIVQKPLFERRGIQPFHDFPEGPDWWNSEDYKAIFSQLPKLKMNFFGLHTYPEGNVGPEPLTWIGLAKDVNPDGTVNTGYHARHFTTSVNSAWGFTAKKTSTYSFGAGQLFSKDEFGADYMENRTPWPRPADEINLFNDMGKFLADAMIFAKKLGIKTCIGTEIPLILPNQLIDQLKKAGLDPESAEVRQRIYEGIFTRIKNTHPLDFYWFWTNENWTWKGDTPEENDKVKRDFDAASKALESVKPGFKLATCGWVLGPVSDRALFDKYLPKSIAFSCINRHLGWEPVDTAFVRIEGREKWAIPWMEDDPGMIIPQLWVGRMRRDAADAYAYGCNGYFGIHWRTKGLSMNVSALAKAAWEQPWNPEAGKRISQQQIKPYLVAMEGADHKKRDLSCLDFYQNWCKVQFGESVSTSLAQLFSELDGVRERTIKLDAKLSHLPRPATWVNGPGNIMVDITPWDTVKLRYAFVEKMEKLRPSVVGKGNLERFEYWLNQFKYLRATGKLACSLGLAKVGNQMMSTMEVPEKKYFATREMLPLLKKEIAELDSVHRYLISLTSTWGEIGNVANWQQHVIPYHIQPQIREIVRWTKDSSFVTSLFPKKLEGIKKIVVPSPQTTLEKGKDYTVKLMTFNLQPKKVLLYWKVLGQKNFSSISLKQTSGTCWSGTIPGNLIKDDFEYCLTVSADSDYFYPVSAPKLNFAVVQL